MLASALASVAFAADFISGLLGNGVFGMNKGRKLWSFLVVLAQCLGKAKEIIVLHHLVRFNKDSFSSAINSV